MPVLANCSLIDMVSFPSSLSSEANQLWRPLTSKHSLPLCANYTFTNKNGVVETKSIQQLNAAKRTKSTLAAHVWEVRDSGLSPTVEWSILLRSNAYQPGDHYCGICLGEVTLICFADPEESLNKRTELRQGCRHKAKFKLNNFHPP